jgi:ABC-type transport system involved in multi-copper enzyme maturation permease subunit
MNNFAVLLKAELKNQTHSFIFVLMTLVSLLITFTCGYIQLTDYTERLSVYHEELRLSTQEQKGAMVYSQFSIPVLIAPNLLSVFHKGIDESIGNKIIISPVKLPEFQETAQRRNPFLSIFSDLDISNIVKILSLFTLILSAGLISREKENNIYKLIFANSVKKTAYYLSKYCATGISVLLSLIILFLSLSILIKINSQIQTSGFFWIKLIFIFFASYLYLSIFILLGLLLSSLSRNAGISVLWGVLLWITISFIYPNLVSTIINKPIDSDKRLNNLAVNEIIDNSLKDFKSIKYNDLCNNNMIHIPMSIDFNSDFPEQKLLAYSNMFEFVSMSEKCVLEGQLFLWENLWKILFNSQRDIQFQYDIYRNKQIKQEKSNYLFTCFLPDILYESAVSSLSNTGINYRDQFIRNELRFFRTQVFDYLNSKKAFTEKFFTQFPKDEWIDNWNDYTDNQKKMYGDGNNMNNYPHLSYADAPSFHLSEKFQASIHLFILLIFNIVIFLTGLKVYQLKKNN